MAQVRPKKDTVIFGRKRSEIAEASASWTMAIALLLLSIKISLSLQAIWIFFGVVAVALYITPVLRFRNPFKVPPWEVVLLMLVPAAIHVSQGSQPLGSYSGIWRDIYAIAISLGLATLGFLIIAELEMYTSLRVNRAFAGLFLVIFTMAVAGVSMVVVYFADMLYEQESLATNGVVMGFFIYTFAVGIIMAVIYDLYTVAMPERRRRALGFEREDQP
jgi:hypothetical protein